jgi:hypothetical protein
LMLDMLSPTTLAAREPSRLGLVGRDKFARWLECFCKRLRGGGVTIIGDKRRHLPLPGGLWGKV